MHISSPSIQQINLQPHLAISLECICFHFDPFIDWCVCLCACQPQKLCDCVCAFCRVFEQKRFTYDSTIHRCRIYQKIYSTNWVEYKIFRLMWAATIRHWRNNWTRIRHNILWNPSVSIWPIWKSLETHSPVIAKLGNGSQKSFIVWIKNKTPNKPIFIVERSGKNETNVAWMSASDSDSGLTNQGCRNLFCIRKVTVNIRPTTIINAHIIEKWHILTV